MDLRINEPNEILTIPDDKVINLTIEINCPNLTEMSSGASLISINKESDER